jgi:hypothetical protein
MTGHDLGTGPVGSDRRVSWLGVAATAILGPGLMGFAAYLWVSDLALIAIVVGLVGLALAGAAVSGWRQNRADAGPLS